MGDSYRNGRVHVLSERCSTCVFRPQNLMNLPPGRFKNMVKESQDADTAFTCHQTLDYGDYEVEGNAVCRGYYDAYGDQITPLRLARAMGIIAEDPPPTQRRRYLDL